ncbi:MAG: amidohydrolase [Planctomycetes bacterium]|nr:amidohydrolase [Planctomycetota bacterium]
MPILDAISDQHKEMTAWRRDLHAHPQTAFEETYASDFIAKRLASWGIQVHRGLAKTGVVGTLPGNRSGRGPVAALGLRADIDALDITEQNDFAHKSQFPGKMHACGHDGHTTMLLGAAKYLAATRNFSGTVHFVFQPAEENEGGGRVMVDEGLFEKFPMDAVFGMHNWPGMAVGRFGARPGPIMAAFDIFEMQITGSGTHAAMPHLGVDPIVAASQVVTALQTIASRNTDPLDQLVLSVTQFHAGDTWNVIPPHATLRGTVRTFRKEVQDATEAAMSRIMRGIGAACGASGTLRYERRCPATQNSPRETDWSMAAADDVVGSANVNRDPQPCMGSEDFAFMLQKRPGCYIWVGNGPSDNGRLLHNPRYDFNDEILPLGASYWARLVEKLLA